MPTDPRAIELMIECGMLIFLCLVWLGILIAVIKANEPPKRPNYGGRNFVE